MKIQYPGLEAILAQDLKAFRGIVRLISLFFPDAKLDRIYEEIQAILLEEIDFTIEAENTTRFRENFKNHNGISAPVVYTELCTPRVLVTEYIDGVKIDDLEGLKAMGTDGEAVCTQLIDAVAHQLFEHGFYHADPHPGNLLVRPGPEIVFIDFGAACEISETTREGMVEFIQAGVRKDTAGLVRAMQKMGFIAIDVDPRVYDKVVAYFHDRFHQEIGLQNLQMGKIKFSVKEGMADLASLKRMNISLKEISRTFHVPREWVLLERALLLLMGIVTEAAPELDVFEAFTPHLKRFSVKYGLDPSSLVIASMREVAVNGFALPKAIRSALQQLSYGDLSIRWGDADRGFSLLFYLVQELFFGVMGYTLLSASWRWESLGYTRRASLLTVAAGLCGVLFLRAFFVAWSTLKRRR